MPKPSDFLLTAMAPAIWGTTYIVTTQLLPDGGAMCSYAAVLLLYSGTPN